MQKKIFWAFGFLVFFYFLYTLVAQPIKLTSTDTGRHLANGKVVYEALQSQEIAKIKSLASTNFYSYTQPQERFINHHLGSGLIFYLLKAQFGFEGLHIFSIALLLLAVLVMILFCLWQFKPHYVLVACALALPLLITRQDVRPENFSYLFIVFLFASLAKLLKSPPLPATAGKFKRRLGVLLGAGSMLFFALWVNLHIYFIFGIAMLGFATALSYMAHNKKLMQILAPSLFLSLIAIFANPNGTQGVLAPLTIFNKYGYTIAENKSVWFMLNFGATAPYYYFIIASCVVAFAIVLCKLPNSILFLKNIKDRKLKGFLAHADISQIFTLTVAVGFCFLALFANRNSFLCGVFSIYIISALYDRFYNENFEISKNTGLKHPGCAGDCAAHPGCKLGTACAAVMVLLIVASVYFNFSYYSYFYQNSSLGLEPTQMHAAHFIQESGLQGPVFNNYDIGSYLIYATPHIAPFVDNRPEAYTYDFFQKTYIPAQQSARDWQKLDNKHNFNSIVFYYRDMTNWGQDFLKLILANKNYAPVFANQEVLILARQNSKNRDVIAKYKLPSEMFVFK